MNTRSFHSSYIVDVKCSGGLATLSDSMRGRWYVDLTNEALKLEFTTWMNQVFKKGISQTLTVFEYVDRGKDADIENHIVKFCGVKPEQSQING